MIPASLPNFAGTIVRPSWKIFIVRSSITLLIGPKTYSPARATPPPITIRSGLSSQTMSQSVIPIAKPTSAQTLAAILSPDLAHFSSPIGEHSSSVFVRPAS